MRRLGVIAALAVMLLGACGGADRGSPEDLSGQIDSLDLPASMVQLDEHYTENCAEALPCPTLVRWFSLTEPADTAKPQILAALDNAGIDYREVGGLAVISGNNGDYIFHVILEQSMLDQNQSAPSGTNAEIVVSPLDRED